MQSAVKLGHTRLERTKQGRFSARRGDVKMKRSEILGLDVLAAIALVGWFMFGPWINLYGFSFYHGRGDVWLPTPPPAINFFHGIVLTGSLLLAVVFLIISLILFTLGWWTGSDDNARAGRFAYRAFYGRA